jgi:hypothetical protein
VGQELGTWFLLIQNVFLHRPKLEEIRSWLVAAGEVVENPSEVFSLVGINDPVKAQT